jgi:hypothetical protein
VLEGLVGGRYVRGPHADGSLRGESRQTLDPSGVGAVSAVNGYFTKKASDVITYGVSAPVVDMCGIACLPFKGMPLWTLPRKRVASDRNVVRIQALIDKFRGASDASPKGMPDKKAILIGLEADLIHANKMFEHEKAMYASGSDPVIAALNTKGWRIPVGNYYDLLFSLPQLAKAFRDLAEYCSSASDDVAAPKYTAEAAAEYEATAKAAESKSQPERAAAIAAASGTPYSASVRVMRKEPQKRDDRGPRLHDSDKTAVDSLIEMFKSRLRFAGTFLANDTPNFSIACSGTVQVHNYWAPRVRRAGIVKVDYVPLDGDEIGFALVKEFVVTSAYAKYPTYVPLPVFRRRGSAAFVRPKASTQSPGERYEAFDGVVPIEDGSKAFVVGVVQIIDNGPGFRVQSDRRPELVKSDPRILLPIEANQHNNLAYQMAHTHALNTAPDVIVTLGTSTIDSYAAPIEEAIAAREAVKAKRPIKVEAEQVREMYFDAPKDGNGAHTLKAKVADKLVEIENRDTIVLGQHTKRARWIIAKIAELEALRTTNAVVASDIDALYAMLASLFAMLELRPAHSGVPEASDMDPDFPPGAAVSPGATKSAGGGGAPMGGSGEMAPKVPSRRTNPKQ